MAASSEGINTPSQICASVSLNGFICNIPLSYGLVVLQRVMFCEIIRLIRIIYAISMFPVYLEILTCFLVSEPVVSHVPSLGSFLVNVLFDKTFCCRVVSFQWGWGLGMPQVFQYPSNDEPRLRV